MDWFHLTDEELRRHSPPPRKMYYDERRNIMLVERLDGEDWMELGYAPRPCTRRQWFVYHLGHGLLMRYPLHKVLWFALRFSKPRDDAPSYAYEVGVQHSFYDEEA